MAEPGGKLAAEHVDDIRAAPNVPKQFSDSGDKLGNNVDDEILQNLEQAGQEVGMTWRSVLAAGTMASSYNSYVFTLLLPPAILSLVNSELGPSPVYTWITISWNLGAAILVTVAGRLSDIFGRRWFFLTGAALLVLGGIIGATGQSIPQMIASGAVFGAGSGFLETAYGAVQEIVPNEYRMVTIGLFDIVGLVAQIMPLVGWAIIKYTGNWRICYYLMIGFHCFNFAFLFFFYNPPSFEAKHGASSKRKLLRDFDWIGLATFVIGCTLFIIGLNWGGSLHPWTSAATICPIVIGFSMIVALGFYERYGNVKEPLLPPRLFKNFRQFTAPTLVIAVVGMQYYSNATLWPRLSQMLYASDEISKGLYSCVIPLGSIIGGIIITFSKIIGGQRWQVVTAIAVQTACVGAMSTATQTSNVQSIILTCIVSICTTVVCLNGFVIIGFGITDQDDIGTAAGLAGTARLLFGAVAVAIFSNVTNNKYAEALISAVTQAVENLDFPSEGIAGLAAAAKVGTAEAFDAVPGLTDEIRAAAVDANKEAYLEGARLAYLVALAFGLVGCVIAFFIPSIDPRKYNKRTVAVQEKDRSALQSEKLQEV